MIGTDARQVLLVVEDDPLVRMVLGEFLQEREFIVHHAANAHEAMAILEARPDVVGVISDIDMPGVMNGLPLAWEITTRWPSTPVTLISGLGPPTAAMMPPNVAFLQKPVSQDALMARVFEMVGPRLDGLVEQRSKDREPEA